METGVLRQILLITDGCSNRGENPIQSAKLAFDQGITVNVIGILDEHETEVDSGLDEVERISEAGGGISQIVYKENLSQTVQAVSRQAMSQTLKGFVNKELSNIFGKKQTIEEIEPDKRSEVVEVMEELGETCQLEVLILVDTSASMHDKLLTVKEALIDLSINLHARIGENTFTVYQFPGRNETITSVHDWAPKLESISVIFPKLVSGGVTPTGPAIREAMYQFGKKEIRGAYYDGEEYTEER